MTAPIATELPLQVEPTTADTFRDPAPDRARPEAAIREFDRRHSDGIDVSLVWNQTDDQVAVAVSDAKTGEAFVIPVEPRQAVAALHHPDAYAASRGGAQHALAV
jgi:hypothetical protein